MRKLFIAFAALLLNFPVLRAESVYINFGRIKSHWSVPDGYEFFWSGNNRSYGSGSENYTKADLYEATGQSRTTNYWSKFGAYNAEKNLRLTFSLSITGTDKYPGQFVLGGSSYTGSTVTTEQWGCFLPSPTAANKLTISTNDPYVRITKLSVRSQMYQSATLSQQPESELLKPDPQKNPGSWTVAELGSKSASRVVDFTPETPSSAIEFEIMPNASTAYIAGFTVTLTTPIDAPTITDKDEAYKDHLSSYYQGEFRYIKEQSTLEGIVAPTGAQKDGEYGDAIMYWAVDKMPEIDEDFRVGPAGTITVPSFPAGTDYKLYICALGPDGTLGRPAIVNCHRLKIPMPEFEIVSPNFKKIDDTYCFLDKIKIRFKRNSNEGRPLQRICYRIYEQGEDLTLTDGEKGGYRYGFYIDTDSKELTFDSNTTLDAPWQSKITPDKTFYLHVYTSEFEEQTSGTYYSKELVIPLKLVSTNSYSSIRNLTGGGNEAVSSEHNGQFVAFTCPLTIQGNFTTALTNTDYLYVTDPAGNAIKVVSHGDVAKAFPDLYKASEIGDGLSSVYRIPAFGIAGRYRHNDGFPEIEIRNADVDFMPYLDNTVSSKEYNLPSSYSSSTVNLSDFNGHRILTGMTKQSGNYVADKDGNVFPVIDRLRTGAMDWTEEDNGKRYSIECFIGQYDGTLSIFPVAFTLDTPRPVASFAGGNIINESDGDVHIINNAVTLNLTPEFSDTEVTYEYSANGGAWTPCSDKLSFTVDNNATYALQVRTYSSDTKTYCANPLKLTFRHHQAETAPSIADFKGQYLDEEGNLPAGDITGRYFRMTGEAVVEQVTPYYIYVRDNITSPGSRNHLLIYNDNGWDNAPRVTDATEPQGWRKLRPGDIITDFALNAARTPQGNLRSDATGYARTFTVKSSAVEVPADYDDRREVDYETATDNEYFEKYVFTTENRMMHYRFENVLVAHRPNPDYSNENLIVVDNGDGTVTKYNDERMRPEDIVDEFVYTLKLGPQSNPAEVTGLDIRFNVFTGKRGGWVTSYDPDRADELYYTITGVVVRDEKRSATGYSIALLDFDMANHAKAPAAMYIDGHKDAKPDSDGAITFIHAGVVKIDKAADADPRAVIYYTVDGTNPKSNRLRKTYDPATGIVLPADEKTVTVRAYAAWPGAAPSAEVSATFRRLSETRTYILNFINDAREQQPYLFNGIVKVAAVGGNYMFVRGVAGHYLPIHFDSASGASCLWNKSWEGQYLTDFVIGAETVGSTMRGAKVTDDYSPFMSQPSGTSKPESLTHEIVIEPDAVTEITAANARRLVTISNVALEGVEFEAEATTLATEWTLIPDKGHAKDKAVKVNHTMLDFTMPEKGTNGRYYNVTGFVMLDKDGTPELWPTAIDRVETARTVTASFDSNATVKEIPGEDDYSVRTYLVEFYPMTVVTLTYEGNRSSQADIHYIFTEDEQTPAADAKWNVYGQPFTVGASGYIHVMVQVPGMEESVHTHIELVRAEPSSRVSGRVEFTHDDSEPGKVIVTIKPVDDLEPGTYSIYYTTESGKTLTPENGTLYTGPITITTTKSFMAILVEAGKSAGEVCETNVWVHPIVTGIEDIEGDGSNAIRVEGNNIIAPSGSVVFDLNGRRVNPTGLASGVYIVRIPEGTAIKVKI